MGYNARKHHIKCTSWNLVCLVTAQGLVLTLLDLQDASANRTTYTIFCPQQTPQACNLALEFPFIFVEGPETVEFHGTYTSTLYVLSMDTFLPNKLANTVSALQTLNVISISEQLPPVQDTRASSPAIATDLIPDRQKSPGRLPLPAPMSNGELSR